MKKLLIIIVLLLLLGCTQYNNKLVIQWIDDNEKPIICTKTTFNGWSMNWRYSLQSADNNFYYAGELTIALPDTIQ